MSYNTMNDWFLSLTEEQQKILREDKWMLANTAFEAGRVQLTEETLNMKKFIERIISEFYYQKISNNTFSNILESSNLGSSNLLSVQSIDVLKIAQEFGLYKESE